MKHVSHTRIPLFPPMGGYNPFWIIVQMTWMLMKIVEPIFFARVSNQFYWRFVLVLVVETRLKLYLTTKEDNCWNKLYGTRILWSTFLTVDPPIPLAVTTLVGSYSIWHQCRWKLSSLSFFTVISINHTRPFFWLWWLKHGWNDFKQQKRAIVGTEL